MKPLIELKNLSFKIVPHRRLFENLNISLDKGKTLAIMGKSGCGKTTLGKALLGFKSKELSVEGEILILGQSWNLLTEKEKGNRRGKLISMIFQDPNISFNPFFILEFQLLEVLKTHLDLNKDQMKLKIKESFMEVGLGQQYLKAYPHELSGGEKQRALIAMALICDPQILVADEPTASLDLVIKVEILKLLQKIQKKRGLSLILITHDPLVAYKMADEILEIKEGKCTCLQYDGKQPAFFQ